MPDEQDPPELTIETVTAIEPDQLDDAQKTFLTENSDKLTEDQRDKYGVEAPYTPPTPEARKAAEEAAAARADDGKGDDDDDSLIDPEDEKKIGAIVDKRLSPYIQANVDQRNVIEVDEFIRTQSEKIPNVGKYRDTMLTYMKTPGFERVLAKDIFKIVAGDDLMRLGAAKEREASAKAKATQVNSSSARPSGGAKKDWNKATPEEYAAKRAEVLGRLGSS